MRESVYPINTRLQQINPTEREKMPFRFLHSLGQVGKRDSETDHFVVFLTDDKRGDKVNDDGPSPPGLTVTSTAGEIVRFTSTTSFGSKVLWDPAQFLVTSKVSGVISQPT